MSDDRLKIAVFIDFDNIEIGVKSTLGAYFDIGSVLEALKERGEVVTKIAYGDWTRAGDYGRSLSQHAVHMVQRNLTPGGDKNGADINLALDALEMAFTHSHINSFVIVSGDSDFISLVEKLKQYDRKVFVVGGRAFTSVVMQKNCTEFIAYENIVGRGRGADRSSRSTVNVSESPLSQAMPLVRRALKLLNDREVLPQLGLLKSTLLQLDSAFSEREYGAGSFRDFVQKLAKAGYVTLKGNERSFHVELREGSESAPVTPTPPPASVPQVFAPVEGTPPPEEAPVEGAEPAAGPPRPGPSDLLRVVQDAIANATNPRWPLYIRQVKQLIRAIDPQFDERKYGFGSIVEALRHCQREGVLRLERDRQGIVRVWPAGQVASRPAASSHPHDTHVDSVGGEADASTPSEFAAASVDESASPAGSDEPSAYEPTERAADAAEPTFPFEQIDSEDPPAHAAHPVVPVEAYKALGIEAEAEGDDIGNRIGLDPEPPILRPTRKQRAPRGGGSGGASTRPPRTATPRATTGARKTTAARAPRSRKPKG